MTIYAIWKLTAEELWAIPVPPWLPRDGWISG
jgi:hypothetical protein